MFTDQYGLPCQSNGDRNDQLQRASMIAAAVVLTRSTNMTIVQRTCIAALANELQPWPGVFVRYTGAPTNNCSADQIISAICAISSMIGCGIPKVRRDVWESFIHMMFRLGFAQNTRDGLSSDQNWKIPDFMFFRAAPLFARSLPSPIAQIVSLVADLYLIVIALSAIVYGKRSPENVDQNVTVMTIAVCRIIKPTPLSAIASFLFGKFLPENMGNVYSPHEKNHVMGALDWYHRADSGGNPEVAEMWRPIVENLWP